jgi:hypothetical protein
MSEFKIEISREELVKHLRARGVYHARRAATLHEQAEVMERSNEAVRAYSMASSISFMDPVAELLRGAETHLDREKWFTFVAGHLSPTDPIHLDDAELTRLELLE